MSSPVVEKEFLWKFRDEITQGVAKARQAMQEAVSTAKEAGMKVSDTGEDWKKMGTDAKETAQDTSQSLDTMKEKLLSYQHAATDASKNIREQFNESKQVLNGIPKQKIVNVKAQIDDNKLKPFEERIQGLPPHKQILLNLKGNYYAQLENAKKKADETKHSFSDLKGTMAGTFLGGATLGGIYAIGNGLKEAAAAGMEFNTEQQKMQQTWLTLTDSKQAAQGMVDTINELSVKTGQSRDLVNELEQGFYHLHSSKEESDAMTKSMLNMGDAVGLTSDQMKQVEQDMVHGLATGKVTQGELNQIGMYFPMIDEAMAKHFNTTVKGMREMAHAGKISGEDLEKVFEELGSGKYEKAADNMMQSMWGMERTIKSQAPALIGAFERPLFNAKNPFYEAVSKWMLDPATQKGFENAGKVLSDIFNGAITGVADVIKPFQGLNKVVGAFIGQFASGAWKGIKESFEVIGIALNAVDKAIELLLTPVNVLSKHLNGLGEARKPIEALGAVFGTVLGPLLAIRGAIRAYNTALLAYRNVTIIAAKATKAFAESNGILSKSFLMNPITLAVTTVIALAAAFKLAYDHSTRFRNAVNRMAQIVKDLFHGKIGWREAFKREFDEIKSDFEKFINLLKGKFGPIGKAIADAFKPIVPVLKTITEVSAPAVAGLLAFKTVKNLPAIISGTRGGFMKLIGAIKLIPKATVSALEAIGDFAIKGAAKLGQLALAGARSMKALATSIVTSVKSIGRAMIASFAANPIAWIVAAVVALGVAFYEAYKHCKTFRDGVNKAFEWISKGAKTVLNFFKNNWKELLLFIANPIIGGFALAYKNSKSFRSKINSLMKGIKDVFTGKAGWEKDLKKNFSNMQKEYQKYSRNQTRLQEKEQKEQQKRWNNFWSGLTKKTRSSWNDISKHTQNGVENVRKSMQSRSKSIEKTWNNTWSTIGRFTQNAWKNIKNYASSGVDNVHDAISGGLNTINRIWNAGWNAFANFFKGIWNGIKQAAADGMNGVISVINAAIGGINKVWSFFTGHGTGLKELGKVHFAQGGTVHRHLSVINDGDGPNWKELVQTPDGNLFMSQERNWTGFLPEGTRVYSGAETRQIMNAVGVSHYATGGIVGAQHFADGGIIGEGIDWAKGSLENIGSWLGDKFSALEDFLADPLKATKGLLEKATSGMYKGLGNFADVAHGAMDKLTQPIADWFKKGLEKLEAQFESGGASPDLIRAAAAKMHVAISGADISHIMNVIKHESGGNAHAINNWDINAKHGDPSKGILQFISSTFRKYAVAGHTNIYSPFDQLLAMFNDTTWRSDLTLGGWGPTGGRRFATGGEVFGLTNAIIGDNPEHHEFILNPYAVSAEPLLDKAFEATAQAQPATQGTTTSGNSKLDAMIDLLAKMVERLDNIDPDVILDGESIRKRNNKENAKDLSRIGR
ncbi:tape measure protein [Limosilactobacillus reuteri]|uniref:Tape measure protein N-terminal domain-containing protein n=1 Tax=Limosilactobacillus reuteri TaxID=1598 RepID=A0A256VL92_LIMRT|nr:tape measure protein [Limosilactobacillus reuteri]OYS60515.1 hypothetical protein CBF88_02920 [Limosilactobacillus reuteri]OYS62139.1 hypothetical protein CBF91_03040 [Limosilactobacillus reuteri]OYS65354.1 hypothetical protein CBF89_02815 [Limosilactobacillus reuteri]OYS73541.1 hypothetical protein CBG01_02635 [Limosilactobacillus reuteri]OYS75670.1 hypothetical protein CBG08_04105 [Limosilactobacillus reuteri]